MSKTKYRTHNCGELTAKNVEENVILSGWVDRIRKFGKLIFINLRDRYGITQIVLDDDLLNNEDLKREYVIQVEGIVSKRKEGEANESMKTGEIEIKAQKLKVLSRSEALPIDLENIENVSEDNRLKYRYLDLRRKEMQNNLMTRYKITKVARDFFEKNGFIEIETPMLAKSTPEGARDYVVPSRVHTGSFYALPQSPQLFKQILMVSGFDRYMQIAKCFRDEDLRADRQPEFTQVDVEMSFVEMEDVIQMNENFIKELFLRVLNIEFKEPFKRLTFKQAMEDYGSDKPDIRFELKLKDFEELKKSEFKIFNNAKRIKGVFIEETFSNKQIKKLEEVVKIYKAKGLVSIKIQDNELDGSVVKFLNEEDKKIILNKVDSKNGTLFIVADEEKIVLESLGRLRLKLGDMFELFDKKSFGLVWVTDFPLFEWSDEEQRFMSMHHPFTMPNPEDLKYLDSGELDKIRSLAYDLAINGNEAGGGSIRIHDKDLQKKIFLTLGISEEEAEIKFGFLLNAFKYGVPPHGGIAFGLDRLAAIFTNNTSIKEVIAFPKNKAAINPLDNSPSEISEKQLEELGIKIRN